VNVAVGRRNYGDRDKGPAPLSLCESRWRYPMIQVDDLSCSLIAFEQISTLVIVVELSQSSWLTAGVVPGIERRPLKKLDPDPTALLHLVEGWRDRATKAGRAITRTVLAFESGRDGFWLARWLRVRGVETFVMHSTSVAVSREPRRAKTDRLDTEMLIRVFLGWLRGEPRHCKMGDPHARGRRRQASQPRARNPGGRTHEDHQSHEGSPRASDGHVNPYPAAWK
jgi:hypothetical protein